MKITIFAAMCWVSSLLPVAVHAGDKVSVTDFHEFSLGQTVNEFPNALNDGKDYSIIDALRSNGNAHGYSLYIFMMKELPTTISGKSSISRIANRMNCRTTLYAMTR